MRTPLPIIAAQQWSTPGSKNTCGGCNACKKPPLIPASPDTLYHPQHLIIEITNRCNLDCIMCTRRLVQPDDIMSLPTFELCREKLFYGPVAIELSGLGEPTLAEDFPYMASTVYDAGKMLYFPTNGAGLAKPQVMNAIHDSERTVVNVSIDAATKETYGFVRVDKRGKPGDWDGLMEKICIFRKAKPNAIMAASFVAGGYNVDEWASFIEMTHGLGFNIATFTPVRCWGLSLEKNSLRFRKTQTEAALAKGQEMADKLGMNIRAEKPYYASGSMADAGEKDGVINYLDIVPLDILSCPNTGTGSDSSSSDSESGSSAEDFGEDSIGAPRIREYKSPRRRTVEPGKKNVYTLDVMLTLTDGTVTSCGAQHPIGHVERDDWDSLVREPRYQSHLRARGENRPLDSQFCRSCEKMM